MQRFALFTGCLLILAYSTGCSMCQSAGGYASPVVDGGGHPQGGFWYRQGSRFSGTASMASHGLTVGPRSGTPTPAEPTPASPSESPESLLPSSPGELPSPRDSTMGRRRARPSYRTTTLPDATTGDTIIE